MGEQFKLAGAPITWGVCEVPGWGEQLLAERVLEEMSSLGLTALEVGPVGYLGDTPEEIRSRADAYGMCLLGGFVPLVLHRADAWEQSRREAREVAALYSGAGATNFVTAVVKDANWGNPEPMNEEQWGHLAWALGEIDGICEEFGMQQVVHPHVGTMIETFADIEEILRRTSVHFCFDTGHLAIGGADGVVFARENHGRISHVHLKDVRLEMAGAVLDRTLSLVDATRRGIFCSLGDGDVPVVAIIQELRRHGYDGWYVLEQDVTIETAADTGLPLESARRSIAYLERELGLQIMSK
jgi:inosose dehydratase